MPKRKTVNEYTTVCWIHRSGNPVSTLFLHEHHRQPQAYGGEDDPENLIWLCTNCHDLLHRLATMASSGKGGAVEDALNLYLPNEPAARERLSILVREVLSAKSEFVTQLGGGLDAPVKVTLEIPRSIHSKLKTLSMNYKHRSGRKSGLAAYLIAVLTHHATASGVERDEPMSRSGPQRLK